MSVGDGGTNVLDDVFTVQMLLNHVDAGFGGSNPSLQVGRLVGLKAIGAINRFQQLQLGFHQEPIR